MFTTGSKLFLGTTAITVLTTLVFWVETTDSVFWTATIGLLGAVVAVGTAVEWDTLCGTTRATVTCVDGNRVTLAHADGAFFAVEPTRFQTLAEAVSFLRPSHWCLGGPLLAAGALS